MGFLLYQNPVAFGLALSFNPDNKLRLFDGENIYSALINDKEFLEKVANGKEVFAKNDILVCKFRSTQYFGQNGKLKIEHSIEKVLEHRQQQVPPKNK